MSYPDEHVIAVAEQIDQLMTTEIGGKFRPLMTTPFVRAMYDASRKREGGAPLSYQIARTLKRVCRAGHHVIFATGFTLDLWMEGETDGPVGAATLARALERAFDIRPIMLTEAFHRNLVTSTMRATGLRAFDLDETRRYPRRFSVVELPIESDAAARSARELFDRIPVAAIVAVEKPGSNQLGVYHNLAGRDITHLCGKIEAFFDEADRRGIPTISMIDGANEVGSGVVAQIARKILPNGERCACICQGGTVATSMATHVFPAFTSNWAAYAVEATLAFMLDKPTILHDPEMERHVLRECGNAGGIASPDGYSGTTVDRMPEHIHVKMIELLHYLIGSARAEILSNSILKSKKH